MLVRLEILKDPNKSLVVCEIGRVFGEITELDFEKCKISDDFVYMDEDVFYHVDKKLLLKLCSVGK